MAQTWPVSKTRIAALKACDMVGRALATPLRALHKAADGGTIERILVIEPWNIGDVVLATPMLSTLRERFPRARVSLLAKSHAADLLKGSGLVDEVIVADLPWTAQQRKYRLTPSVVVALRKLVSELRKRHFDVTIDARMDIRSNILAATTGARQRIGYDIGGGGWLLTDTLPSNRDEAHKVEDWLALIGRLDGSPTPLNVERVAPKLVVEEGETNAARKTLTAEAGDAPPTIGYHPGGSHAGKRWPRERFEQLIAHLKQTVGGRHVVFVGPEETGLDQWPAGVTVVQPSLRELMALISCCDVFVSNDSGPMHIADSLGVPVVAIFEVGNPQWFGPSGARAQVIRGELAGLGLSAAPLDHPPRNPVPVVRVANAVKEVLAAMP
jgi:ADP-heptose:LPS heptosyltransferase